MTVEGKSWAGTHVHSPSAEWPWPNSHNWKFWWGNTPTLYCCVTGWSCNQFINSHSLMRNAYHVDYLFLWGIYRGSTEPSWGVYQSKVGSRVHACRKPYAKQSHCIVISNPMRADTKWQTAIANGPWSVTCTNIQIIVWVENRTWPLLHLAISWHNTQCCREELESSCSTAHTQVSLTRELAPSCSCHLHLIPLFSLFLRW